MPISYNSQDECWEDSNDPAFWVDMTPEGGEPTEEFATQEDFWKWYRIPVK